MHKYMHIYTPPAKPQICIPVELYIHVHTYVHIYTLIHTPSYINMHTAYIHTYIHTYIHHTCTEGTKVEVIVLYIFEDYLFSRGKKKNCQHLVCVLSRVAALLLLKLQATQKLKILNS